MKVRVRGKDSVVISKKVEQYAEKELTKLSNFFKKGEVDVNVLIKGDDVEKVAEITIPTKTILLRSESKAPTIYEAIDKAIAKLDSQIKKHKDKIYSAFKKRDGVSKYYSETVELDLDTMMASELNESSQLAKTKVVELTPMTSDEAIAQMEMLGHDFFVFLDKESTKVCIVYLRQDYTYGIIETK
jgi:putative sigma-54 modulation protein